MAEIAELCGVTAAEVRGTATFYDMFHTEPVGTYVVSVCTNIACLLGGALELLEHAESALGMRAGGTTTDGVFTLEESECLADCDRTPCVQVNHRYVGAQTPETLRPPPRRPAFGRAVRHGASARHVDAGAAQRRAPGRPRRHRPRAGGDGRGAGGEDRRGGECRR